MIVRLGDFPTPVTAPLPEIPGLAVKRDDLASAVYGGNKLRKLEHLLGAAKAAGKRRIVTLGAVGSHQIVATTIYGKREGFDVEAVLVAQPASTHAEANVRAALGLGLSAHVAAAWALAPPIVLARLARGGRDAYFVPLGGSNAIGSLGFVDAAAELAAQVRAGETPEPDVIVVASGSGGTVAGLAVGLEREGMRARVVGVAVSPPVPLLRIMTNRLARATARLAGLDRAAAARAVERITIDGRWLGRGYGHPTGAGAEATAIAARAGLALEPTYTAKAFACALDLLRERRAPHVLYWHTLGAASVEHLPRAAALPPRVARLLAG